MRILINYVFLKWLDRALCRVTHKGERNILISSSSLPVRLRSLLFAQGGCFCEASNALRCRSKEIPPDNIIATVRFVTED